MPEQLCRHSEGAMGKQQDTQVVTIKSIDEHPRVVELLKEIERLKSD